MDGKTDSSKRRDENAIQNESEKSKAENQCPICLESISNLSRTDPCAHEFCLHCLQVWCRDHSCCPVCRQLFERILYNFREDNKFDSMVINNRESRLRQSLLVQRDALRHSLDQISQRVDQQLEVLRQRLRQREELSERIQQNLIRIRSLDRENNHEFDETLNQARNAINELEYQDFVDGVSNPRQLMNGRQMALIREPIIRSTHDGLYDALSDILHDGLTVNQETSTANEMRHDISPPGNLTWHIPDSNSIRSASVYSNDSGRDSAITYWSARSSHSVPENLLDLNDWADNISVDSLLLSSPSAQNQNLLQNENEIFDRIENRVNHMIEEVVDQNINSSGFPDNRYEHNSGINGRSRIPISIRHMGNSESNAGSHRSFNSIVGRHLDSMNRLNQNSIQIQSNVNQTSNQNNLESDSDLD